MAVAGDQGAVTSAMAALAGAGAPMANVRVLAATPVIATLTVNFNRDPRYGEAAVEQALRTALVDPDLGVLGANVVRIGQGVYESQIAEACLAVPGVVSYAAAKGGLSALARALAAELGAKGITSNALSPGFFGTETNVPMMASPAGERLRERCPAKRWAEPWEIAGAAVFLASPAASYVNGHTLTVDGGVSATYLA